MSPVQRPTGLLLLTVNMKRVTVVLASAVPYTVIETPLAVKCFNHPSVSRSLSTPLLIFCFVLSCGGWIAVVSAIFCCPTSSWPPLLVLSYSPSLQSSEEAACRRARRVKEKSSELSHAIAKRYTIGDTLFLLPSASRGLTEGRSGLPVCRSAFYPATWHAASPTNYHRNKRSRGSFYDPPNDHRRSEMMRVRQTVCRLTSGLFCCVEAYSNRRDAVDDRGLSSRKGGVPNGCEKSVAKVTISACADSSTAAAIPPLPGIGKSKGPSAHHHRHASVPFKGDEERRGEGGVKRSDDVAEEGSGSGSRGAHTYRSGNAGCCALDETDKEGLRRMAELALLNLNSTQIASAASRASLLLFAIRCGKAGEGEHSDDFARQPRRFGVRQHRLRLSDLRDDTPIPPEVLGS